MGVPHFPCPASVFTCPKVVQVQAYVVGPYVQAVGPGAANSLWKSSLEAGKCHHTWAEGWCLKQSVTRKNKRLCFAAPVAISIFMSNFYSLTAISDLAYFQTTEEIIFLIPQWSYHTPLEVYLLNARLELLPIFFFLFSLSLEFSIH